MSTSAEILATIALDMKPKWIAASPDGSRVYEALFDPSSRVRSP